MIECIITANGSGLISGSFAFAQQDQLNDRWIISMQAYSAVDMPNSPLQPTFPVVPDSVFAAGFLTIFRLGRLVMGSGKSGNWYKNMPLVSLRNAYNMYSTVSSNLDLFRCDPMKVSWQDTNINFPFATAFSGQASVPFLVDYLLEDQDPIPYMRAFEKGKLPYKV